MILSVCPNPSIDTYAWMENFNPGEVNRIEKIQEFPGGKGVHVALALAELGAKSELMGCWAGMAGEWIKNACRKNGIAISGVALKGNNRKCYTFRSEDPNFNHSELLEPGPIMNTANWEEFKKTFQQKIKTASLVCLSGSWPKEAPADAYKQLIDIANSENIKVILDCSGSQLKEALKSSFFGLHINQTEAEALCGSSNLNTVLDFLSDKIELLALTKGKEGLELSYKNETFKANVVLEHILSSVGSGDCLTAGIAFAISKEMTSGEIAAYGTACGAANCITEALGMLEKKTVEKLLPKVETEKIKS